MSSARGPEGCSWRPWEEKILVPFPERHVVPVMHDAHKFSKSHFNQYRNLFESLLYRFFFFTWSLCQKYVTNLKFQRTVEMQLFSATQNVKNSFLIIFLWLKIRLNTKDSKLLTGLIFLFSMFNACFHEIKCPLLLSNWGARTASQRFCPHREAISFPNSPNSKQRLR